MASAGTVTVDFAAETAKFTAELKKVQGSLKGLQSSFSTMEAAAGVALKVFAGGALIGFAKSAFDAADATADAAQRAGIAVESFSKLQYAAGQADVEVGAFTTGITKFQVAISKAADGNKAANATLAEFGIKAAELRDLKIEEQLAVIADKFALIPNAADRTRLAVELFGKSAGPQLVPLLAQGSAGIRELTAEADRLGITMSEQTAVAIGEADAALKRMKATLQGITARTLGGFALMIEDALALINGPNVSPLIALQEQSNALLEKRKAAMAEIARLEAIEPGGMFDDVRAESLARANQQLLVATDLLQVVNGKLLEMGTAANAVDVASAKVAQTNEALRQEILSWGDEPFNIAAIRAMKVEADEMTLAVQRLHAEAQAIRDSQLLDSYTAVGDGAGDARTDAEAKVTADLEAQLQARSNLSDFYANQAKDSQIAAEQAIVDARNGALNAGIDALQAYAGESKNAAKALVVINKARAIAEAIQNTYVGATLQLTNGDPYTATFRAAAVVAFGLAQVAAIVKSGQGEIGAINAHGGAPSGSPSNPVYTRAPASTKFGDDTAQGAGQSVLALHVHGNYFGSRETVDYLMQQFKEQINTRDVVLFSSDSRQAQELAPA